MKCHLNVLLIIANLSLIWSKNISVDDDTWKVIQDIFGTPTTEMAVTDDDTLKKIMEIFGTSETKNPARLSDVNVSESTTEFSLTPRATLADSHLEPELVYTRLHLNLCVKKVPPKQGHHGYLLEKTKLEGASNNDCKREDGKKGVCVTYYQCDPETKRLITSGETLIDIRKKECDNYFEVCCLPNLVNTTSRESERPKQPSPIGCGYSNPGGSQFIVRRINDENHGDTISEFGEFPWMVAILKNTPPGTAWDKKSYIGGGAIIHPKVVLTAAHKIHELKPSEIKCRAGEWDTQNDKEIEQYQERIANKFVIHENFIRPASAQNSIALIILERPFDISSETPHIGVGCLASSLPMSGTMCLSMGWGQDNFNNAKNYASILKKVELPLVSYDRCQKALRDTRLGQYFDLHSSFTCAGGAGSDTCTGDGGSPLVCPISEKRYAIAGLVAWGIGCNTPGVPGVYVHVTEFKTWIDQKMTQEVNDTSSYNYL